VLYRLSNLLKKLFNFKLSQIQTVKAIDRIEVYRNGNDLAIDACANAMLVRPPVSKVGEIFKHLARIRVEYVRPVFMNQNSCVIVMIVSVAAYVWTLVTK
jgi:hypothetical protein